MQARQCIRPNRVHHCFVYGLVIRFQLLSTTSLDVAVAFSYGQTSASVRLGLSPNCWCALPGAHLTRVPREHRKSLKEGSDYATKWTREEQLLLQKAAQDAYLKQFQPEPAVQSR